MIYHHYLGCLRYAFAFESSTSLLRKMLLDLCSITMMDPSSVSSFQYQRYGFCAVTTTTTTTTSTTTTTTTNTL